MEAPILISVLDDIVAPYHSLHQENLIESEIKEKIMTGSFRSYKECLRNFKELMHHIYKIVDAHVDELLR